MSDTLTPTQRLKNLEKKINEAQTEVTIRQRQLKELKPQRDALEKECKDNYDCDIKDLASTIEANEKEMGKLLERLEQSLKAAQEDEGGKDDEDEG